MVFIPGQKFKYTAWEKKKCYFGCPGEGRRNHWTLPTSFLSHISITQCWEGPFWPMNSPTGESKSSWTSAQLPQTGGHCQRGPFLSCPSWVLSHGLHDSGDGQCREGKGRGWERGAVKAVTISGGCGSYWLCQGLRGESTVSHWDTSLMGPPTWPTGSPVRVSTCVRGRVSTRWSFHNIQGIKS